MDVDGRVLTQVQSTVAQNCFKSHTNSRRPDFFQNKFLSDVQSEIHLVQRNIVSTGQSVRALKKIYSGLKHTLILQ